MLKPTLVTIVALDGRDEAALLALAAGAVRTFDGSLAAAILESARERDMEVPAVDLVHHTTESGVVAEINGNTVVVGNAALFDNLALSLTRFGDWAERLQQRGQQVLFVALDGNAAALLGVIHPAVSASVRRRMDAAAGAR